MLRAFVGHEERTVEQLEHLLELMEDIQTGYEERKDEEEGAQDVSNAWEAGSTVAGSSHAGASDPGQVDQDHVHGEGEAYQASSGTGCPIASPPTVKEQAEESADEPVAMSSDVPSADLPAPVPVTMPVTVPAAEAVPTVAPAEDKAESAEPESQPEAAHTEKPAPKAHYHYHPHTPLVEQPRTVHKGRGNIWADGKAGAALAKAMGWKQ
jgi:hypothetical protein